MAAPLRPKHRFTAFVLVFGLITSAPALAASVTLPYAPNQVDRLKAVAPACLARLVGNLVSADIVVAVEVSTPECKIAPAPSEPTVKPMPPSCVSVEGGTDCKPPPAPATPATDKTIPPPQPYSTSKVIPLPPVGINLVRVDQNFGGTGTLIRYAIVSVLAVNAPGSPETSYVVLRRALLEASIRDDAAAVDRAKQLLPEITGSN